MAVSQMEWLEKFLPKPNTASGREQLRAGIGAIVGLMLTAFLSYFFLNGKSGMAFLVAPMGASSVLLFGVPASPLAQPWSVVGGNTVSALVGVLVAAMIADPVVGAAWAAHVARQCGAPPPVTVAGAGHAVQHSAPRAVAAVVRDVLRDVVRERVPAGARTMTDG